MKMPRFIIGIIGALAMMASMSIGYAVAAEPAHDAIYTISQSYLASSDAVLPSVAMVTNNQHQAHMQKMTSLVSLAALRPVDISIMVKAKSTVVVNPLSTQRHGLIK